MNGDTRRLFFALWPDRRVRAEIVDRTAGSLQRAGGRAVHPDNLHLTLVFLGGVPEQHLGGLIDAAGRVQSVPFGMSLDKLGCFYRSRVLWLAPGRAPACLSTLHDHLCSMLNALDMAQGNRSYTPHVTLARGIKPGRDLVAAIEPVYWQARDFALVESQTHPDGARYRLLQRFRLGGPG